MMKRLYPWFAVTSTLALGACPPVPHKAVKGPVVARTAFQNAAVDASGMRLGIFVTCHAELTEHWCPDYQPTCSATPVTTTRSSAYCPSTLTPGAASLHAPWGQDYKGTASFAQPRAQDATAAPDAGASAKQDAAVIGILTFAIDWKAVRGPRTDAAKLRSGWLIHYAGQAQPYALSDAEMISVLAMLPPADAATPSGDPATGRSGEHATLSARLSSEPDASGVNQLTLSVTNQGPESAYKVAAQLRSSSAVIHGIRVDFGVIQRGETKTRVTPISLIKETDELNPTVVAVVSAANAPIASTSSRLRLSMVKRPRASPLQLSCQAVDKESVPGRQVRMQCESNNPNDRLVRGVSAQIAVGKAAAVPVSAPAELAARARVKFDVSATIPADARAGAALPIVVTMNAPDFAAVQQQLTIRVIEVRGACKQGRITRQAYMEKRKKLQDALAAGSLTQNEFDSYDSDLVACLE